MAQATDVQQRLDTIEENMKDLRTAIQALLHSQLRASSVKADDAAATWITGELRDMSAQASTGAAAPDVVGLAQKESGDSVFWCTSRYVCISMQCGGSGWC